MNRSSIPDHQQFAWYLAQEQLQKADLCWLLGTSVHKLAVCISPIFLFFPFLLVKYMELLEKVSTALSVFSGPA